MRFIVNQASDSFASILEAKQGNCYSLNLYIWKAKLIGYSEFFFFNFFKLVLYLPQLCKPTRSNVQGSCTRTGVISCIMSAYRHHWSEITGNIDLSINVEINWYLLQNRFAWQVRFVSSMHPWAYNCTCLNYTIKLLAMSTRCWIMNSLELWNIYILCKCNAYINFILAKIREFRKWHL